MPSVLPWRQIVSLSGHDLRGFEPALAKRTSRFDDLAPQHAGSKGCVFRRSAQFGAVVCANCD
jgi:hypothetical protein